MLTEQQQANLLSGFGPWVASQPADKTYNYTHSGNCAFAQYLHAIGYVHATVLPNRYAINSGEGFKYKLPPDIEWAVRGHIIDGTDFSKQWTFGHLAERLRAVGWLSGVLKEDASQPVHLSEDTLTAGML